MEKEELLNTCLFEDTEYDENALSHYSSIVYFARKHYDIKDKLNFIRINEETGEIDGKCGLKSIINEAKTNKETRYVHSVIFDRRLNGYSHDFLSIVDQNGSIFILDSIPTSNEVIDIFKKYMDSDALIYCVGEDIQHDKISCRIYPSLYVKKFERFLKSCPVEEQKSISGFLKKYHIEEKPDENNEQIIKVGYLYPFLKLYQKQAENLNSIVIEKKIDKIEDVKTILNANMEKIQKHTTQDKKGRNVNGYINKKVDKVKEMILNNVANINGSEIENDEYDVKIEEVNKDNDKILVRLHDSYQEVDIYLKKDHKSDKNII